MKNLYFFIFLFFLAACNDNDENIKTNNEVEENSADLQIKNLINVYKKSNFEFLGRIINDSFAISNNYKFSVLQINYDNDTCKILHYLGANNTYIWNEYITITSLYENNNLVNWQKLNCTFPLIPKNPYDLRNLSSIEIKNNLAIGRLGTSTYPPLFTAIKIFSNDKYIRNFNLDHYLRDISANDIGLTYKPDLNKVIITTLNQNYEQREINYNSSSTKSMYNFTSEKGKNDHVLITGINSPDLTNYLLLARLDLNSQNSFTSLDSILINPFCTNCKPISLENFEKPGDNWYVFEAANGYKEENIIVKIENEKLKIFNNIIDCSGIEYKNYGQIALHKNNIYAIKSLNSKKMLQYFENGFWNTVVTPNFNDFEVSVDLQVQYIKSTPKGLVIVYNGETTSNPSNKQGILDVVLLPR
jgi:hypothetical protein